jgi:hypothetical protein
VAEVGHEAIDQFNGADQRYGLRPMFGFWPTPGEATDQGVAAVLSAPAGASDGAVSDG